MKLREKIEENVRRVVTFPIFFEGGIEMEEFLGLKLMIFFHYYYYFYFWRSESKGYLEIESS